MNVVVGQKVVGKFQASNGKGRRTDLMFPHGVVTEVTEKEFKVKYHDGLNMEWTYKESDIDKIVYLKELPVAKIEEQQDYQMEMERLGIEE